MPDLGDQPLRVPYAGYKGDYQAIAATTPTTKGFPWLARATGVAQDAAGRIRPVYAKLAAGEVFSSRRRRCTPSRPARSRAQAPTRRSCSCT